MNKDLTKYYDRLPSSGYIKEQSTLSIQSVAHCSWTQIRLSSTRSLRRLLIIYILHASLLSQLQVQSGVDGETPIRFSTPETIAALAVVVRLLSTRQDVFDEGSSSLTQLWPDNRIFEEPIVSRQPCIKQCVATNDTPQR